VLQESPHPDPSPVATGEGSRFTPCVAVATGWGARCPFDSPFVTRRVGT